MGAMTLHTPRENFSIFIPFEYIFFSREKLNLTACKRILMLKNASIVFNIIANLCLGFDETFKGQIINIAFLNKCHN